MADDSAELSDSQSFLQTGSQEQHTSCVESEHEESEPEESPQPSEEMGTAKSLLTCMMASQEIPTNEQDAERSPTTQATEGDQVVAAKPLEAYDWQATIHRFQTAMQEKRDKEDALHDRLQKLLSFYSIWSQVTYFGEEERAAKRLRTRIAYVEKREDQLWQKREHHQQVQAAFQQALALLGDA